jgi:hypothetical protein
LAEVVAPHPLEVALSVHDLSIFVGSIIDIEIYRFTAHWASELGFFGTHDLGSMSRKI